MRNNNNKLYTYKNKLKTLLLKLNILHEFTFQFEMDSF